MFPRMLVLVALAAGVATSSQLSAQSKPNIIVIMADDVGWSNPSCYHSGIMSSKTPHIDRIAREGIRFTDHYAQPSCTAGRSAFLTGQFPIRTGMHTVGLPGDDKRLSNLDPTVAQLLKKLGYSTGQFGKNHLGDSNEALPTRHGFDEYWGWLYHLNAMEYASNPDFPKGEAGAAFKPRNIVDCKVDENGNQVVRDDGPCPPQRMKTLDDEVTTRTLDFIERKAKDDQPFFCWMCPARAHIYTYFSDRYKKLLGTDSMGMQEVVMKELDDNVGKVLEKLDALGIADNTIVVFTSDNGPEIMTWPDGGMTPFHGEKGTTWEGGFRVPMVVRWPARVPAGQVSNGVTDHMDFLPTLVAAAGGPDDLREELKSGYEGYRVHLDGYNQLDLMCGKGASNRKEVVYYEGTTLQAVRYKDWKAHFIVQNEGWFGPKERLGAPLLFNLRRDPFERAADESGHYIEFLGKNMWAFGPAKRIVQEHLATFKEFPSRSTSAGSNAEEIKEDVTSDQMGQ